MGLGRRPAVLEFWGNRDGLVSECRHFDANVPIGCGHQLHLSRQGLALHGVNADAQGRAVEKINVFQAPGVPRPAESADHSARPALFHVDGCEPDV